MAKNEEKTIPFLRRLLQMMKENEHAMSFVSGDAKKNIPGRFVIHDRALVEAEILPKYFNHASFASLRRQLNYFHFVREGKGRMKGATYYNDAVFVIDDILNLRRRNEPVGATNTEKKVKAKVQQAVSSDNDEDKQDEIEAKPASTTSSRKKAPAPESESESTKVIIEDKDSPATIENSISNAHIISPSESMEDMSTKGEKNNASSGNKYDEEEASIEGSLASYKNIQTDNQKKKPTIVLDLTRPSESDFTTPFYAHGYASFSQLQQQQQHQYCNEASYVQPMHHYQHAINHDAGTFAATTTGIITSSSEHESPHPITPPSQEDTTWEDEMLGCSALLALQNCGPAPSKKPRQVSA